jgi:hypothetical protein
MIFGDRYRHVVHPLAGHISYVMSPGQWLTSHPMAFKPNPIDLILGAATPSVSHADTAVAPAQVHAGAN